MELGLDESIRYAPGDRVERWLYDLLCLDAEATPARSAGRPQPAHCELYYVNRDALFAGHAATEDYLRRIWSLYVSSHYRVSQSTAWSFSALYSHLVHCRVFWCSTESAGVVLRSCYVVS